MWISVKDRLPPLCDYVLLWFVTVDPKNSGVVFGQRSGAEENLFWDGTTYRPMDRITHWQPLPPPPVSP